jgi:hypothetical protein
MDVTDWTHVTVKGPMGTCRVLAEEPMQLILSEQQGGGGRKILT